MMGIPLGNRMCRGIFLRIIAVVLEMGVKVPRFSVKYTNMSYVNIGNKNDFRKEMVVQIKLNHDLFYLRLWILSLDMFSFVFMHFSY